MIVEHKAQKGEEMELLKNQVVVFSNGTKEGYLSARWSDRHNAFYTFTENGEKLFSTTVLTLAKKETKFIPSAKNCKKQIFPVGETDKAYQIEDGSNGHIGRTCEAHYKYIAKSICYIDSDNNVFAPIWA